MFVEASNVLPKPSTMTPRVILSDSRTAKRSFSTARALTDVVHVVQDGEALLS